MDAAVFWKEAAVLSKRIVAGVRLDPRYVGGDTHEVKADMEQEGLMSAAAWLSDHEEIVDRASLEICRSRIYAVIKTAMFDYLKQVNRENGHELSASDWLENIGDIDEDGDKNIAEVADLEQEEAQDTLDEIIENNENETLKASITCLDKEMQAVVLLHNDGFSFTVIASKMNFSRERPRQLYHRAMRQLKEHVAGGDVAHELPLNYPHDEQETLLYSTQDEKIQELKFRVKSTRGNISRSTRMMRREGKGGQLSLF
ncbi:sigma-70 family RNA polymerase sigma factor [Acidithiobacillus ferridurans]|nr:sigma-70 family RNA polymerase sigma factor [Acidithiobacillus ferridurans]